MIPEAQSLAFYKAATEGIIPGFRKIFCPPLPLDERQICKDTSIRVIGTWGIGAFATRGYQGREIRFTAGTSAMIDALLTAMQTSEELSQNDTCFGSYAEYYAEAMSDNTTESTYSHPSHHVSNIVDFAAANKKACPNITMATFLENFQENAEFHARQMESSIAFILLHELGHHVLSHIGAAPLNVSLEQSRQNELAADTWAIRAATKSRQHLFVGLTPIWLTLLQGSSLQWEQSNDHPLGVRRALNFFATIRSEYENTPDFRRVFEQEGKYAAIIQSLDRGITIAKRCLSKIERTGSAERCE